MNPPYTCQFCGQPSWIDPADQYSPPDYCHPEDHGDPDEATDSGTSESLGGVPGQAADQAAG